MVLPKAEPSTDDLLAEVADEIAGPRAATDAAERFGMSRMGQDIGTSPRRGFAQAEKSEPSLLELRPEAQALLAKKAAERGMLGPESERVRDAHERAAMVAELVNDNTWTTSEDITPGRRVRTTKGVAGATWQR